MASERCLQPERVPFRLAQSYTRSELSKGLSGTQIDAIESLRHAPPWMREKH
jgi:hypothetical protein